MAFKRLLYSPFFYTLLIFVGFFSFNKLIDLDLGFHLAQGRYFFENNFSLPKTEVFSYTMEGRPNIIISWLFDVLFYGAYLWGGFWALSFWKAIVVVSIVGLFILRLISILRVRKIEISEWFLYASSLLFLISTFSWINIERPHALGYIYFSLFLWIFFLFIENAKKWHWLVLLLIQILWANTHTSFASGIGFTGLFWLGLVIEYMWASEVPKLKKIINIFNDRTSEAQNIRNVFLLIVLQVLVSCINPYGIFIYLNVLKASFSSNLHLIRELWPIEPQDLLTARGIFFFLGIFPFCRFIIRRDFKMALTYLAFLILGFRTGRLFFDFIVFSAPITMAEIFQILPKKISQKSLLGLILTLILVIYFIGNTSKIFERGSGISYNSLPVDAPQFILKEKIIGPMFNSYGLGSHLIWGLYPNYQVYLDGRAPVYDQKENNIITEYYSILGSVDEWKKATDKYGFNFAVVDWPFMVGDKIYNTTAKNLSPENWVPVFWDSHAIIYVRKNDVNKKIIEKYGYKYINPQELDSGYFKNYLTSQESWETAEKEFQRAIELTPQNYRAYFMYASFLALNPSPDNREIVRLLRKTLDLNPNFTQARGILEQNYGVMY